MPEEFQPGDLIEIIGPDRETRSDLVRDVGFNDEMEDKIGGTFAVKRSYLDRHGHLCYDLDGDGGWTWAHEWLKLVKAVHEPKLTEKDFEDAF